MKYIHNKRKNAYIIEYYDCDELEILGETVQGVTHADSIKAITLAVKPSLEGIVDGIAFHGEKFMRELPNILLTEETAGDVVTTILEFITQIHKLEFIVDSYDEITYQPTVNAVIHGIFEVPAEPW